MADTNASLIISAATFGGTAFGVATSHSIRQGGTPVFLRGQGKRRPSVAGFSDYDTIAVVTYIANITTGFIARGTSGALSITMADLAGGGTKAYAPADMMCIDCELNHQDRTFAIFTAQFVQVDSGDDNTDLS